MAMCSPAEFIFNTLDIRATRYTRPALSTTATEFMMFVTLPEYCRH